MAVVLVVGVLLLPALVALLDRALRRRARRAQWRGCTTQESPEAMRGWKVAQIVVGSDDRAWLAGLTGRPYGVDDAAGCERSCLPPGLDCQCGFYAYRDRDRAIELLEYLSRHRRTRTYVLLTVDLDGTVLEYELGFRAARQRVHRIEVPSTCAACWRAGDPRPARSVVAHPSFRTEQVLYEGPSMARTAMPFGSAPIRVVCEDHEPPRDARPLDLDRLRTVTATEVHFMSVPTTLG